MTTLSKSESPELLGLRQTLQTRTPARLFVDRAGPAYRTVTQLALRQDHAFAIDAVHTELDPARDFGQAFIDRWGLFTVSTRATSKAEYLLRPDLGRSLSDTARADILHRCPAKADLQIAIGDGLSADAVVAQVPAMLDALAREAQSLGWSLGQPCVIRYCRVGVLNDIGELLDPAIVVLLIGERPGLVTAESLSAYMAYRPRTSHTDAERNLISNIHARGVTPEAAAVRIVRLAARMRQVQLSGVAVKEEGLDSTALLTRE
jgi:ethanolamine ammonia-lyase small subunit